MHRVYISASTQYDNVGVANYGTEQDRMQHLADRITYFLKTQQGKFEVFRNRPNWTLRQTIDDCNNLACAIFIDNHTNAGALQADGTEVYFHNKSENGQALALAIFQKIAPLTPGADQGCMSDYNLYPNKGLAVLRETNCPAALIEHFYHTNITEVEHYLSHIDVYAKATAQAICDYFGEKWVETLPVQDPVAVLVDKMIAAGLFTSKEHWYNVLTGKQPANSQYLQIVFQNTINKLR